MASVSEQRCTVCGLSSPPAEIICPRCGTIFPEKEAECEGCGAKFDSIIAMCPSCGGTIDQEFHDDVGREEAVQRFQLIPGVTKDMASKLYDKGIRSFADLIEMSLPESERKRGLHRIIARRLMLSGLMIAEDERNEGLACVRCRGHLDENELKCQICGAPAGAAFLDLQIDGQTVKLGDYMDELYQCVKGTLRGSTASKEIDSQIANAIAKMDEREIFRQEYRNQIEAWREKGFDVSELEEILDKDFEKFKERSLEIIKAQVKKKESDVLRCPLCNFLLKKSWKECPNCGAKFDQ
ncbi:MAG: hypothetical protein ACE5QW_02875 [Thermoplasmata archaeon]